MSGGAVAGPLAGIRVLDLTRLLPGPVCTLYLADLGADVVKIEDTGTGDYARSIGARPGGVSAFYRAVNRNKRSVSLDLKHARGRALFLALAKDADVVVEGFRPGAVAGLGIDYEAVAPINRACRLRVDHRLRAAGTARAGSRPRHQLPGLRGRARPVRGARRPTRVVQCSDRRSARRRGRSGDRDSRRSRRRTAHRARALRRRRDGRCRARAQRVSRCTH